MDIFKNLNIAKWRSVGEVETIMQKGEIIQGAYGLSIKIGDYSLPLENNLAKVCNVGEAFKGVEVEYFVWTWDLTPDPNDPSLDKIMRVTKLIK
jgi:hypothetical protein